MEKGDEENQARKKKKKKCETVIITTRIGKIFFPSPLSTLEFSFQISSGEENSSRLASLFISVVVYKVKVRKYVHKIGYLRIFLPCLLSLEFPPTSQSC